VGQQSLPGLPGVLGQVPEQGQAYARIEVLLSEDPTDELLELKLHKLPRSCRVQQGWLSRVRHCRRSGVPLLVVSRWEEFGTSHQSASFRLHRRASGWAVRPAALPILSMSTEPPPFACPDAPYSAMAS
jgi:hypothetical protein